MKGFYLLFLKLEGNRYIEIGKLGKIFLKRGYYVYVGSAMGGEKRVFRHFKREKKRHWHIDYLLDQTEIVGILYLKGKKGDEVKMAEFLKGLLPCVEGFGSSDSPLKSHLFYSEKNPFVILNKINFGEYK